jgi:EF hand
MRLGVPLMGLVIVVVAAGLTATPGGAEELRSVCDADHNGTVTVAEAQGCAAQRLDLARGAADGLVQGQFAAALPDADGLRQQFAQVDQDGDGRISRDEWLAWFGPAYAGAAKAAAGQPIGTD